MNIYRTFLAVAIILKLITCTTSSFGQKDADAWYKNSIIYNVEVSTFKDSDHDGKGDFIGLAQKLDYLDSLGINTIWLAPFLSSPGKDDGYDVSNFYTINPELGTYEDFKVFMTAAKRRGMKVIADIVLNHTSIEHPWFTEACTDSTSAYRNWYVWSNKRPKDADKGMVFPGVQKETWTFDSCSGLFYFHRFYNFQPDLNYSNPAVQKEAYKILQYWLMEGLDGFRLDAVPFIIDRPETGSEHPEKMLSLIPRLRQAVQAVKKEGVLLGEANLAPKENQPYFGKNNNGMQMMFNFFVNQYLFYALATAETDDLVKALRETKEKPEQAQWAFFLRNHDEIDLGRLSKQKREEVFRKFGPDTSMQLYHRGIRRRLAPMLQDEKRIRLSYSFLFSLPGTPVLRYGEEIGMGDDLSLNERLAVRTPMQWSDEKNAGFTTADKPFRNIISEGVYRYQKVNVKDELRDSTSLLNFVKKMIRLRKEHPEINAALYDVIKTNSKHVVAFVYPSKGKKLVIVHNFSNMAQRVQLKTKEIKQLKDLIKNDGTFTSFDKIDLEGLGFKWYEAE
jgi:maltose alpha-D-glucosyltransferase/alpha-amylase